MPTTDYREHPSSSSTDQQPAAPIPTRASPSQRTSAPDRRSRSPKLGDGAAASIRDHHHRSHHHPHRHPHASATAAAPSSTGSASAPPKSTHDASGPGSLSASSSSHTLPPVQSNGVPDFVKKLFKMLEDTSYSDVVSWGVRGDSFVIKNPNEFAKTVLPRHFKHNNPASFVRQLNKYGFHKVKTQDDGKLYGEQAWEFQHPNFQYNNKEKLEGIKRKTPKEKSKIPSSAAPPPPANEGNHNDTHALTKELKKDTRDLQTQMDAIARMQTDMATYLQGLSRNYCMVVDEILNIRKNMATQDKVVRNLVECFAGDSATGEDVGSPSHLVASCW
ncbi:HSF-type DNA-binding-domain-containing protein [Gaertneriomyces semiglobifer]|nr:HSF-type DNA-binding-domain-containing protein [Gaertneriomyces semiglobifer]